MKENLINNQSLHLKQIQKLCLEGMKLSSTVKTYQDAICEPDKYSEDK